MLTTTSIRSANSLVVMALSAIRADTGEHHVRLAFNIASLGSTGGVPETMVAHTNIRSHGIVVTSSMARVLSVFIADPEQSRYGLELMHDTGLSGGTVYPVLIKLEQAGWVTSSEEDIDPHKEGRPRRRNFTITPEGLRAARTSLADLDELNYVQTRAPAHVGAPNRLKPA
ncbi:PadR family transcriptional regulator [Streptomyces platensis]|uniref:PadR family transcriptional regulator n=1 Tax=Streptomyces platensis TaxID=58346 RepID=UPI003C2C04D0